jgi:hypothetical protein
MNRNGSRTLGISLAHCREPLRIANKPAPAQVDPVSGPYAIATTGAKRHKASPHPLASLFLGAAVGSRGGHRESTTGPRTRAKGVGVGSIRNRFSGALRRFISPFAHSVIAESDSSPRNRWRKVGQACRLGFGYRRVMHVERSGNIPNRFPFPEQPGGDMSLVRV